MKNSDLAIITAAGFFSVMIMIWLVGLFVLDGFEQVDERLDAMSQTEQAR